MLQLQHVSFVQPVEGQRTPLKPSMAFHPSLRGHEPLKLVGEAALLHATVQDVQDGNWGVTPTYIFGGREANETKQNTQYNHSRSGHRIPPQRTR